MNNRTFPTHTSNGFKLPTMEDLITQYGNQIPDNFKEDKCTISIPQSKIGDIIWSAELAFSRLGLDWHLTNIKYHECIVKPDA